MSKALKGLRPEKKAAADPALSVARAWPCHTLGLIFWLRRNRFVGSYLFFSDTSRS